MSQELEKAKKIKDQSLDQIKQQIDQLQQLSQQLFTQVQYGAMQQSISAN